MRIHTNANPREALRNSGAPISFYRLEEHRSSTHEHAYEVRLEGSGGRNNTGLYGAGDYNGATWDEWGAFFGALYELDATARCGGTRNVPTYADADDYHFTTGDRFRRNELGHHMPADTHPRHRWVYQGAWGDHGTAGHACGKDGCSATLPSRSAILERRAS